MSFLSRHGVDLFLDLEVKVCPPLSTTDQGSHKLVRISERGGSRQAARVASLPEGLNDVAGLSKSTTDCTILPTVWEFLLIQIKYIFNY